jgi:HemY protein
MAAIEAHEWREAEAAIAPYLDDRPPARICALMARIEAGEGNKGREREWLARAVRAPRDRAWIADGYISDRWLPVSPVSGTVDAFEWKAPVDAIGRGDATLLIEERIESPESSQPAATSPAEILDQPDLPPAASSSAPSGDGPVLRPPATEPEPGRGGAPAGTPRQELGQGRPKPELFVPPHAPDDPGIAPTDADESPASLERLRAAQIR